MLFSHNQLWNNRVELRQKEAVHEMKGFWMNEVMELKKPSEVKPWVQPVPFRIPRLRGCRKVGELGRTSAAPAVGQLWRGRPFVRELHTGPILPR